MELLETGNRLKLAIGFLSILALLMMGYSGTKLLLLYDTPLFGISSESKLAKIKWNRLKLLISEKEKTDWSKSIYSLIKVPPPIQQNEKKSNSIKETKEDIRYMGKPLQKITGILITSKSINESNASVLIDGKLYSVMDEVSGYMIKKITNDGVSLTKNGKYYFIEAPTVPFSADQGE